MYNTDVVAADSKCLREALNESDGVCLVWAA